MPLPLPKLVVAADGSVLERPNGVASSDVDRLAQLPHPAAGVAERLVPLTRQRWAVGKARPEGAVWRILDVSAFDKLIHPAYVWNDDPAFSPDAPEMVAVPAALPLRMLIRRAAPMFGSVRTTCQCLAAVIAGLRRRRRPVALIVTPNDLVEDPARAFVLAVLTMLPLPWRRRLRASTREDGASASEWDLVLTRQTTRDFLAIHPDVPPAVDSDLVASYILDRLLNKDPEAVEAAAFLLSGDGDDPWGDGVHAHLAGGVPGFSPGDTERLNADPRGSVHSLARRLKQGAALDGALLTELIGVTHHTADPLPWQFLGPRSPTERDQALAAVLPHLNPKAPSEPLLRVLATIVPPTSIASFAGHLLEALRQAPVSDVPLDLLTDVIGAKDSALDTATRASLWQEVTVALVERHEPERAVEGLLSAVGRRLATEGGATALVNGFLALPQVNRTSGTLRSLVDVLAGSPEPDTAMALLWTGIWLERTEDDAAKSAVLVRRGLLQHWARIRTSDSGPLLQRDRLLERIAGTPSAVEWGELVAPLAPIGRLKPLLSPVVPPENAEDFWRAAERARSTFRALSPRQRLEDLTLYLPEAATALVPLARELLDGLYPALDLPAPRLSAVAADLAELPDASPIWMWLAIVSQVPRGFSDETIDATVIAFCESPPRDYADRVLCQALVERLGGSPPWSAYDLARWLVRLSLAPDGDDTAFGLALANQLLRAIARRPDGLMMITHMTRAFFDLPPHDPALRVFLARLLPNAWVDGPPSTYLDAIGSSRASPALLALWREALGLES